MKVVYGPLEGRGQPVEKYCYSRSKLRTSVFILIVKSIEFLDVYNVLRIIQLNNNIETQARPRLEAS